MGFPRDCGFGSIGSSYDQLEKLRFHFIRYVVLAWSSENVNWVYSYFKKGVIPLFSSCCSRRMTSYFTINFLSTKQVSFLLSNCGALNMEIGKNQGNRYNRHINSSQVMNIL